MTIQRPWGTLNFLDEGAGRPVVLLHPLAAASALWRRLIDDFSPYRRVLAPDARGHGRSTWDGEQFSVIDLAADIEALIENLDAGPADVVGLSMGGCTAVAFAIRRPDLVHNLVLADTTADYGPHKADAWGERAEKAVSVPRDRQLSFQLERWFSTDFRNGDPEEVARICEIFLRTDSAAHAAACRALGDYDDSRRLNEIRARTLILVGDEDYATPPSMARALHSGIVDSRLEILPHTRHLSLVENAAARKLVHEHLEG
ncbi:alpha/beta fold hydrolase [Nocardia bovistercoris]|uniref:alpha/beta fold hydrolase n=1 Tax=Nocardia bovistercoris TaxID=2785916 RepID=UPI0018AB84E8|nr:alpha/beta hydrolase [Nocardia bovistercoris]